MISFAAHHRKAVRLERRDQIRREVREAVEMLARCEAGDPEALRQSKENYRALTEAHQAPSGRYFAEPDYPEPDEVEADLEPDEGPGHALRPGESERQYRRRMGRPDLAERRAALLLARGYWDARCPLPGAIREALCALSMAPRELRRMLFGIWERGGLVRRGDRWRRICGPRELAHFWAVDPRELPIGWPGDDGRGLEVCPLRGPPAGAAAVGITLPDCTGGAVVVT
jgi:hypothetical protein